MRDLTRRNLAQHLRGGRVIDPQAQFLAQLVDRPRLQLAGTAQLGLLVVQAISEASQERRHLAPQIGARRRGRLEGQARGHDVARPLLHPRVGPFLHGQAHRMAPLHEDADSLEERIDVLLLFDDDEELHRAAPSC